MIEGPHQPFNGPYVRAALICERVLEERDGVWSIVRIIDRFTQTIVAPDAPDEMAPLTISIMLALYLTPGEARGSHDISVRVEAPSGLTRELLTQRVTFEAEDRSTRLLLPGQITFSSQGLYWFHVALGGHLLTKVPLRIVYQRVVPGGQAPGQPMHE